MYLKVDFDKFLDTATVQEYVLSEKSSTPMDWQILFWSRFLIRSDGSAIPEEEARLLISTLTLRAFQKLRVEGELRDIAVPPTNGSS